MNRSKLVKYAVGMVVVSLMALYPVYTNYHKGLGLEQYARHIGFLTGDILFPNPWQYRVLSHWVIEGLYQLYDATIGQLVDLEALLTSRLPADTSGKFEQTQSLLSQMRTPGFVIYNLVFVGLRFMQHLLIFWVAYLFYQKFVQSKWMLVLGLMLISLFIGNSVNDSDLAFNTYFDVLFYLAAGYIIVSNRNDWYILPLTILGALNRETSVLIPFMYFIARIDWANIDVKRLRLGDFFPARNAVIVTVVSYLFFWGIFFGLRFYYGTFEYQGVRGEPSGFPTLAINLFSPVSLKTYFELFGTMALLPLLFVYGFKKVNWQLRVLFVAIVPFWFGVHFWAAVAYQSRLFLVPTLLVLLPGVLQLIEQSILQVKTSEEKNKPQILERA